MTDHDNHDHTNDHDHDHVNHTDDELLEEQSQIAQEIGAELTDAFVSYVRGDIAFDDLVFGVFDALSDLNVVASGEYELEEETDDNADSSDEDV